MTQVDIPFRDDMAKAALEGRKTSTSRNKCYGKVGDIFLISACLFELTDVTPQYLSTVAEVRFTEEGFDSPAAFIGCWKELHPRNGWEPHKRIWFHEFRKVARK